MTLNLYEIQGYGNTFLVKATEQSIAENKIHAWAIGEGFLRAGLQVRTTIEGTK
jgi:hypothetical protein